MKRIVTVVGARPQFIKAAPVSRAIISAGKFEEILVHTGQHYDDGMSQIFFDELSIPAPKYNLEVGSGSHGEQTGEIMKRLEPVLIKEKPGLCLIYGDTNTTLAAAITASKLHVPVAHIEAGLRSFNRQMPEEINRILADHVSDFLFCPTFKAMENLKNEGITKGVHHVGDVMYDAALLVAETAEKKGMLFRDLELEKKTYLLLTIHRAENTDSPGRLECILKAVDQLREKHPVVFPMHPRTRKMIEYFSFQKYCEHIIQLSPLGFQDMVALEKNALCIITDSGGVQKEAYFHRVPCVTVRYETEWVETVATNWNLIAPPETPAIIINAVTQTLEGKTERNTIKEYGDGQAAKKIVEIVRAQLA